MSARTIRHIIENQEVQTIEADLSVTEAARAMRERTAGAIMVLQNGRLAGIFTERDALFRVAAEGMDPNTTSVADVMTTDPTTIHPDKEFDDALELMRSGQFRHVPVVEDDKVLGMVSSLHAMGSELEQFMYAVIAEDHNRDVLA